MSGDFGSRLKKEIVRILCLIVGVDVNSKSEARRSGERWRTSIAQVNTSGAVTAKVAMGREFSVTSGNTLVSAGGEQTGAYDSVDVGSLSISGLANQEYLFLRASAHEGDDGVNWTVTTNYTGWSVPISADGSGSASMVANAEHRVFTGTGDTSDPTNLGDHTTVYVALKEQAPAATSKPIAPIIFQ